MIQNKLSTKYMIQNKLSTNQKLAALRDLMADHDLSAYYINTGDPHQSEYIPSYYQSRSWLTGFTGSAGYALVTAEQALLWVDGRYFIQAENEIKDSEFQMMKMATSGFPSLEEWLVENLQSGDKLGMNGQVVSQNFIENLEGKLSARGISIQANLDLIDQIWKDRPAKPADPVFVHSIEYTGKTAQEKITEVRKKMERDGVESALYTGLNDIAWLHNIRGNDVKNTPVVMAFSFITQDEAFLYIDQNKIDQASRQYLVENKVTIKDYDRVYEDIKEIKLASIVLDKSVVNHALFSQISENVKVVNKTDYPYEMKACLNDVELKNQRVSYIKDSVALTKFIYWVKQNVALGGMTELTAEKKLHDFRKEQDLFLDESFSTISAYGPNAAMAHYSATPESFSEISPQGFLLVDSGGQYLDGTTDITRTIVCGPLSDEQIQDYTLTLKSHIGLGRAKFLYGTTGYYLDALARQPLWQHYMDYKHGTGHAVGYLLGVHEGPQRFSMVYADVPLEEGMVITNEPGVYKEGKYGIRLENDYVVLKDKQVDSDLFMHLDCLSFVPFDRAAIDLSLLERFEIDWINNYHKEVYDKISPFLNEEERIWLQEETSPLV